MYSYFDINYILSTWPSTLDLFRCFFFSFWVVSDSLQPHGLQHTRFPYPLLPPRVCSNSCPSSWWCYSTILSSAASFSFYLQSFPASGIFPVSQLFTSGGQSTGASASPSVLPMNLQGWFPLVLFYCIFKNTYLFTWLHQVIVGHAGSFSHRMWTLTCNM